MGYRRSATSSAHSPPGDQLDTMIIRGAAEERFADGRHRLQGHHYASNRWRLAGGHVSSPALIAPSSRRIETATSATVRSSTLPPSPGAQPIRVGLPGGALVRGHSRILSRQRILA
jgi:hypothetical protein